MFSNLEYLYNNLPARYRRHDTELLLKRFLTFSGDTMDEWDEKFENFHESITPATATAEWIAFWMIVLFGWSWFPAWFTLADKRRVYGNFAQHLARRGTARGIKLFLREFGIVAEVHTRPRAWGEFVYGERAFSITKPLRFVVEIITITQNPQEGRFYGGSTYGESAYAPRRKPVTEADILNLIKFQQPASQIIDVVWRLKRKRPAHMNANWQQIEWHQEFWGDTPEW